MAQKSIQIADKPTLDEIKYLLENNRACLHIGKVVDEKVSRSVSVSELPYGFFSGSAGVLGNKIHI